MTTPDSYQYQQPPMWPVPAPEPAPPRRRIWPWLLAAVAAGLLAVAAVVGMLLIVTHGGTSPRHVVSSAPAAAVLSEQVAQRECRTAFQKEWDDRAASLPERGSVVVSTHGIDLQETWKTPNGYTVNGVVRFGLMNEAGSVEDTVNLTCTAEGTDAAVITTVTNRD